MKKILRYLSVKQLMEDIADLNGVMSVRRFVLSTMLAGVAVYGACLLYRINYIAALFVMILAVIMIPGLVRNYFMERSKASRFADVDVYLHQMTYSFIRNPKVNIALQDAYAISSGRLKRCLSRAIEELQYGMGERVYEDALKIVEEKGDLAELLAENLGVEKVTLIPCGDGNVVAAAREQWNDGSNTLTIAPGVVVVYDRNTVTNKKLEEYGLRLIKIRGSELVRGRGGPRCMSMPFEREEI